ncbi:hypothetical protein [Pelomonas sp. BJYL3]|uniref:hypothetical protein n=1 Tax=Pelomonas sp. BJYL3 TaxID=2976697 RepID=UPI0022B4B63C|nr:hypothetical protein [Pelomonas sp. BJYL3]
MFKTLALLLCAVLLLAGCDSTEMFERLMPKEEVQVAKDLVAKLAARDFAAVEAALDPQYRTAQLPDQLEAMVRTLQSAPPTSVQAVGAHTLTKDGTTTYTITLEYSYPAAWNLATVVLERKEAQLVLKGINFQPRTQSLASENDFTLDGKGPLHYLVLVMAALIPLFILHALVVCLRSRFERRKWLWVLSVACGLVQFQFNWSSGDWGVQLLSVLLLGAGFAKGGPVAPWVFTLSLPVGAMLFLLRRHRESGWPGARRARDPVPQPAPQPVAEDAGQA